MWRLTKHGDEKRVPLFEERAQNEGPSIDVSFFERRTVGSQDFGRQTRLSSSEWGGRERRRSQQEEQRKG